jgi:F-type H+-transporting ATPase subunit b
MEILASVGDTIQEIQTKFGLDFPLFMAQAINFIIVAWLIWKFAFKGILGKMEDREKEISDSLKNIL